MSEENVHFMSKDLERETPQWLFNKLDQIFAFERDVCANENNAKCEQYFSPEDDALSQDWQGCCWMNPPYGRGIKKWIIKAIESTENGATTVALVAARTETAWFQLCWDYAKYIVFVKGRLTFGEEERCAPFPSAIVIFGDERDLPPDRELTFLAEFGTVVRPIWKYAPSSTPNEEYRTSVPFVGTIIDYRRIRGEPCSTPEERSPKIYNVQELKDARPELPLDEGEDYTSPDPANRED